MIISMTGFGRGEASTDGISVAVEVKSVNSRYLDISLRLPQAIQEKELQIKEQIQDRINRGKLNVNIRVDKTDTGEPEITINPKLVRGYADLLNELRKTAGIKNPLTLDHLLSFNEIFVSREEDEKIIRTIGKLSREALKQGLDRLISMRKKEGEQLKIDLLQRVDHIETMISKIQELTDERAGDTREKLLKRIQSLVDDDTIDRERLELEVAILVDKMDITEELVRLQSHLKFFREAVNQEGAVGRRLNFLSQEINREINTVGSKANNSEISRYVVQAKESLEQIREQVQNVE